MHLFTCAVVAHGESHFREGSTCGSAVSDVAKLRAARLVAKDLMSLKRWPACLTTSWLAG